MKPLIANIGGAFLYSDDPQTLADWYKDTLGIQYEKTDKYNAWYCSFPYRDMAGKEAYAVWSILQAEDIERGKGKLFTINYRVHSIDEVVKHLNDKGVEVKGPEKFDEGKFAWITDPEGNDIELWEDTGMQKPTDPAAN